MTDHTKESFNSFGHTPPSELQQRVWGVIYEEGSVLTDLTYEEAVAALTRPPNGTHAMVTTSEAAEKFRESQQYNCNHLWEDQSGTPFVKCSLCQALQ